MKCPECRHEMDGPHLIADCAIPSVTTKAWSCPNCMELVEEPVRSRHPWGVS